MVLTYSVRITRVPTYSGYPQLQNLFTYAPFTLFRGAFQHSSAKFSLAFQGPLPHTYCYMWFGLFQFRSPLLSESLSYFLFLRVIRWFSSPGSPRIPMYSVYDTMTLLMVSFLIRKSTNHSFICNYSWLIAACHVLLRRHVPRHPPVCSL